MDIFDLDRHVIDEYQGFARSFVKIESADLREQIDQVYDQNAFWPDPYVSLNPNYRQGDSVQQLADDGVLAPDTARVFRDEKGELGGDHAAARPGARHSIAISTSLCSSNRI